MKVFFRNIILFVLCSSSVYFLLLVIIGEAGLSSFTKNLKYKIGSPGFMYTRVREVNKFKGIDVLFIGSSQTYRGFDVRIFNDSGYSCFNLGSSAQTPLQTELLLKRYIDTLKPKAIVFEVSPASFMNDGIESELDLIANDKIDIGAIKNSVSLKNLKVYNALAYGYYRHLFKRDESFTEPLTILDDKYITGGYVERKLYVCNPKLFTKGASVEFNPVSYQQCSLTNIVQLASKKGVKLLLVQAPSCSIERGKYTNYNSIDSFFSNIAPYVNFNHKIHLQDSIYFYDKVHLNQLGVQAYDSAVIADVLKPAIKK